MKNPLEPTDYLDLARTDAREARERARDHRRSWQFAAFASGRLLLGLVFMGSAIAMLADYSGTLASVQEAVVDVHIFVSAALAFQLVAGLALFLGWRARLSAVLMAVYLIATLLVVPPDLRSDLGRAVAFANLGLLSALGMIVAHGAGRFSADHFFDVRRTRQKLVS